MGDVRDIKDHPKFQPKLDPDDPNFEHDHWLRMHDAGELLTPTNPRDESFPLELLNLEEYPKKNSVGRGIQMGLSVCIDCAFKRDTRPWWKRFFLPEDSTPPDLRCEAFPRQKVSNPVTGITGYLQEGPSMPCFADEQEYPLCWSVNPDGNCGSFRPKLSYRGPRLPK